MHMYGTDILPEWNGEVAIRLALIEDNYPDVEYNELDTSDPGVRSKIPYGRLPGDLCDDRVKVLAAVRERAVALKYASPSLRADREVILAAVESTSNRFEFWDSKAAMWKEFEIECVDPAVAQRMRSWCERKHGKEAADQMSFPEVHAQYAWYPQTSAQPDGEQHQDLGWAFQATLPEEEAKAEEGEDPDADLGKAKTMKP
eukprot:scaffold478_cov254-Pinguiococcus_pyrenoidosus.AAC.1